MFSQQLQRRMQLMTQEPVVVLRTDVIEAFEASSSDALQEHETAREEINRFRVRGEQERSSRPKS